MGCRIERSGIIGSIVLNDEDTIFVEELTEIDTVLVVVDAEYVGIEPNLTASEGGVTFLAERDGLDVEFRQHVSACRTGLNR